MYVGIKIKLLEYEYITNNSYICDVCVIYYYLCKNKRIIKIKVCFSIFVDTYTIKYYNVTSKWFKSI